MSDLDSERQSAVADLGGAASPGPRRSVPLGAVVPSASLVPLVRAPSAWNIPNLLTVVRILLVPVFGWLLLHGGGEQAGYRMAAFVVFALAAVTDGIDGDLARRRNSVTDFGKVADPIADKTLMGMALIGLSAVGVVAWWITVAILVREVGVTAMRFVVIRHGVMPASRGGKVKTLLQTVALAMLVFPPTVLPFAARWSTAAHLVLDLALVVTLVTGVDYAVKAHVLRRTSARAVAKRVAREEKRRS